MCHVSQMFITAHMMVLITFPLNLAYIQVVKIIKIQPPKVRTSNIISSTDDQMIDTESKKINTTSKIVNIGSKNY